MLFQLHRSAQLLIHQFKKVVCEKYFNNLFANEDRDKY